MVSGEKMLENINGQTDDRVTGILLAYPWALGSGELKNSKSDMAVKVYKYHFDVVVIQPLEKGRVVNYKYMYLFSPFTTLLTLNDFFNIFIFLWNKNVIVSQFDWHYYPFD